MCSNIPASPAYCVYISLLIRYARASSNYSEFLKRHLHLRNRRLGQCYAKIRLIRSLKKLYISSLQRRWLTMHFHIVKMYKDKEVNKNAQNIFLSMCDVKLYLTFASLGLVLLWQLFYPFFSSIVIHTVIVSAGTFESKWKREVWRFKIWFKPPFL
jgi:hypothetical protein